MRRPRSPSFEAPKRARSRSPSFEAPGRSRSRSPSFEAPKRSNVAPSEQAAFDEARALYSEHGKELKKRQSAMRRQE